MNMNFSVPEQWQAFVAEEVAAGGHANPGAYLQQLLLQAKQRKERAKVEALLEEGLHSGPATDWTKQELQAIRREVHEQHATGQDLEAAYREMAADEAREAEAREWTEGLVGDVADETR